jgi:hypothetical protein
LLQELLQPLRRAGTRTGRKALSPDALQQIAQPTAAMEQAPLSQQIPHRLDARVPRRDCFALNGRDQLREPVRRLSNPATA